MSPILYALNIGTLATWVTVAGASSVAYAIKISDHLPERLSDKIEETEVFITPMAMGSAPPAAPTDTAAEPLAEDALPETMEIPEIPDLPELPDIPEIADLEPLPDIPDLPRSSSPDATERPKPTARPAAQPRPKTSTNRATAGQQRSSTQGGRGTGTGAGTAQGSGDSPVGADRWVGGRMPKPNYPAAARKAGMQGRVVVVFSVDERGYVVSARVSSPSPHAMLNEEALRTVRRWKFRPGPRATASRPIVFQLN